MLMGGYERNFGIFVESVQKGSKASDAGLKRGDQVIGTSYAWISLLMITDVFGFCYELIL